jgi:hypothetical protein
MRTNKLSLVISVMLLATMLGMLCTASPTPPMRTMRFRPGTVKQTIAWQKHTRAKLLKAMKLDGLTANKAKLHFDATQAFSWNMGSYTLKSISIRATPDRMIQIVITVPKNTSGKRPAVVCIGGHFSNIYSTYANGLKFGMNPPDDSSQLYKGFAAGLAKRGYVTIATVVSEHDIYEPGQVLAGQRLWDLMRCVDYLESLSYVDKSRIGCAGLSLGGEMSMWLAAMDTRISAAVSAGWLTVFDQMEQNHCMCWKFPGLRELVDVPDIFGLVAPRPVLCQNGQQEDPTQFPPAVAEKSMTEILPVYTVFGAKDKFQLDIHPGGHEIDLPALLEFFEKQLK